MTGDRPPEVIRPPGIVLPRARRQFETEDLLDLAKVSAPTITGVAQ